jgi:hypothetical protein
VFVALSVVAVVSWVLWLLFTRLKVINYCHLLFLTLGKGMHATYLEECLLELGLTL